MSLSCEYIDQTSICRSVSALLPSSLGCPRCIDITEIDYTLTSQPTFVDNIRMSWLYCFVFLPIAHNAVTVQGRPTSLVTQMVCLYYISLGYFVLVFSKNSTPYQLVQYATSSPSELFHVIALTVLLGWDSLLF